MSLIKKGNPLYSVLFLKCPRCHEGDLFCDRNPWHFKTFFDMPEKCPVCGQKYTLETGFYYGAMYVSYALTIAENVAVFVALTVFNAFSMPLFFAIDIPLLLLTVPYVFRVSRAIWINFFVNYVPPEKRVEEATTKQ